MQKLIPAPSSSNQGRYEQLGLGLPLISLYLMTQQTNLASNLVDELVARPQADPSTLLSAATVYNQLQEPGKLETTLQRLVAAVPSSPEAWYDLAGPRSPVCSQPSAVLARAVSSGSL